jgi:hypothetical protein
VSDQSLREALEEAIGTVEQGIARSTKPGREGFLMTSHLRQMLTAHPALETPCNCGFGGFHDDANPRCDRTQAASRDQR